MQPRNYDMIKILRPVWKALTDTFYTIDAVAHHNCQTNAMVIHHAQTRFPIRSMGPHFGSSSGVRRYRAADLRRPRVYRTAAFGMAQPFDRPFGQCCPRHDFKGSSLLSIRDIWNKRGNSLRRSPQRQLRSLRSTKLAPGLL